MLPPLDRVIKTKMAFKTNHPSQSLVIRRLAFLFSPSFLFLFVFLLEPQQLALAALTDPGELSAVEALTNGSMFTSINTEVTNFPDLFPFSRSCFLLPRSIPSLSC